MSRTLRIGFVVEGPTDYSVLKAVIGRFLGGRDFVAAPLQPEMSEAFRADPGETGFGWPGVCRWCLQTADQTARLRDNPLFDFHDLIILQIDADVAEANYESGHIPDPFGESTLPCAEPCPPASATTDRLRSVILKWLGEISVPPRLVMCIPSVALETWILVGLFPDDSVVRRTVNIECRKRPERTLQSKRDPKRLVKNGKKITKKYEEFAPEIAEQWDQIKGCREAERFERDFMSVMNEIIPGN